MLVRIERTRVGRMTDMVVLKFPGINRTMPFTLEHWKELCDMLPERGAARDVEVRLTIK